MAIRPDARRAAQTHRSGARAEVENSLTRLDLGTPQEVVDDWSTALVDLAYVDPGHGVPDADLPGQPAVFTKRHRTAVQA
jgi:hypothetical protein